MTPVRAARARVRREAGRGHEAEEQPSADSIETRVVRNGLGPGMQPGARSAEHELAVSVRGMAVGGRREDISLYPAELVVRDSNKLNSRALDSILRGVK